MANSLGDQFWRQVLQTLQFGSCFCQGLRLPFVTDDTRTGHAFAKLVKDVLKQSIDARSSFCRNRVGLRVVQGVGLSTTHQIT